MGFKSVDGSAVAGFDYVGIPALSTTIFTAGQETFSFDVIIIDDTLDESAEDFSVELDQAFTSAGTVVDPRPANTTIVDNDDAPTATMGLSFKEVPEGDSGTLTLSVSVLLSATSGRAITVFFDTQDGTAIAGSDYTANVGSLLFEPGEIEQFIEIEILGDVTFEPDETFTVNLLGGSAPKNGTDPIEISAPSSTEVTILNDDAPPVVSLSPSSVTVVEGDTGTNDVTFTLTQSVISPLNTEVNYSTVGDTATEGSDYVGKPNGVAFIPAGDTEGTFSITINGDTDLEFDETFSVELTGATNATISPTENSSVVTIENDDGSPTLAIQAVASIDEGAFGAITPVTLTVTQSTATLVDTEFEFTTFPDTAVIGDYVTTSGTATIPASETTVEIVVNIFGDNLFEADEQFTLVISNPTLTRVVDPIIITADTAVITIINDDDPPTVSIEASVSTDEGDTGTHLVTVAVTQSEVSGLDTTVNFKTVKGTAAANDDDYDFIGSGSIVIPASETSADISVTINGDTKFEPDEDFTVELTSATNATVDPSADTSVVTIVNDDAQPVVSINASTTILEGDAGSSTVSLTVLQDRLSSVDTTVTYSTSDDTATVADSDYVEIVDAIATIPSGSTSVQIDVTINGDEDVEDDEQFNVNLTDATNATIDPAADTSEITIENDDVSTVGEVDVPIKLGFNLIGIPVIFETPTFYSDIADQIASQGGAVTSISAWSAVSQTFSIWLASTPDAGNDPVVTDGTVGYFIRASEAASNFTP